MAWNHTYDVNTPTGSDDPKEGDDRIREIKAALQERLAKDHYFPKTSSQVSDTDAGEHKKVTLRVGSAPTKADDKGFLYAKNVDDKAELFYIDEDGDEVQLTSGGKIASREPTMVTGSDQLTTTSTSFIDMTDMVVTQTFKAGKIIINFSANVYPNTLTSGYVFVALFIDDTEKISINLGTANNANFMRIPAVLNWVEEVTAAEHTIKIKWKSSDGGLTVTQPGNVSKRVLIVSSK